MKITSIFATISVLLALGFPGAAFGGMNPPSFEELDANVDGYISKSEASAVPDLDFTAADKDQNGVLSKSEYEKAIVG
jgi:hypothetical protein